MSLTKIQLNSSSLNQVFKLKHLALIFVSIWLALAVYTCLSQISNWLTSHHFENNFWGHLSFLTNRVWLPWLVLTPLTLILSTWFPVKPKNWLKALLLHSVFLLSLSIIAGLAISLHYHFFEEMPVNMQGYQPWQHIGHFLFGDGVFLFNIIIYTLLVTQQNIKHFAQKADQEALAVSQLNARLIESQLHALKMQINPHFLFNTLNVISVLVMKKEHDKANEMINRLSKFFRRTLDEKDNQWPTLAKELEHTAQYLGIEQVRFGERLQISQQCEPETLSQLVPSMLLQPLIENAMQHGLGEKEGQGLLTITSKMEQSQLVLCIEDDGIGCDFNSDEYQEGIGISNVRKRLKQLYHDNYIFELYNNNMGGVTAKLSLPVGS